MADNYIDYLECREYGGHFVIKAAALTGQSPLADIPALISLVQSHTAAVSAELDKQGAEKSGTRVNRADVEAKRLALFTVISKFYSYLDSLDESIPFDLNAFFEGGLKGDLGKLKPADLVEKNVRLIAAFAVPPNASIPNADAWKTKLQSAEDQLTAALTGKSSASDGQVRATRELIEARRAFLRVYNQIAKPIVKAVLTSLNREHEMPLFFKDLAVNEEGGAKQDVDAKPEGQPA